MKIKIPLLGLFIASSIMHPIYADQYEYQLEAGETDVAPMVEKSDLEAEEAEKDKTKSENLIKLGTTVKMDPAIVYQDEVFSTKNSLEADLTFKADVPKGWCNKDATVHIGANWDGKDFTIGKTVVTIGKTITMGYASSIFGYEKADPALLISPCATVLQIQLKYTFDWFRISGAIERPIPLQVGLFDKTKSEEKGDKKEESPVNKLDEDDKGPFKIKNSFPAIGLNLGVVTDQWNIGLGGLVRCTDYTHSTNPNPNEKNLKRNYHLTYGVNVGIQYQVVPKKFTVTGEGIYVHGLGEYLSGLTAIQKDKARKEMCAAYYIDKGKDTLSFVDAGGGGLTFEYCIMPKWTFSIRGSYLGTAPDAQKPAQAFLDQYNLIPKVAYAVNKYFTFSGGYSFVKERKINKEKNKAAEHKFSGSVKFSL